MKELYGEIQELVFLLTTESYSEIMFRIGQPVLNVENIEPGAKYHIEVPATDIYGKIYRIFIKQEYTLAFSRENGYPLIQIYECFDQNL